LIGSYPFVVDWILELGETPSIDVVDMLEHEAFVAVLQEVSKGFGTSNQIVRLKCK